MSMKKSSDTIGNRTRDLPVCSAVPQPTATLRVVIKMLPKILKYSLTTFLLNITGCLRGECNHTPRRQPVIHIHLLHRIYLHHTPAYTVSSLRGIEKFSENGNTLPKHVGAQC
jgi:hypothetical protein